MKTIISLTLLALCGLLGACASTPHRMDMTQAIQSATTRGDHENLAKHYDAAAQDLQAKAAEHQRMLARYEANKSLYGRRNAEMLITHCQVLVRSYEQAAAENTRLAAVHRQMAAETP